MHERSDESKDRPAIVFDVTRWLYVWAYGLGYRLYVYY